MQIGFRLCHPLPQQTAAVFPVRRHFLAGQRDQRAGGGAGSASQPGKPRAQSDPGDRAARRRPGACSQPRAHVSPDRLGRATRGSRLHLLDPAQESDQNQADIRNLSDSEEGRGEGWGGVGESCREQKLWEPFPDKHLCSAKRAGLARPSPAGSWVQGRDGTARVDAFFYCSHSSQRAPSKHTLLFPALPMKSRAGFCCCYPGREFWSMWRLDLRCYARMSTQQPSQTRRQP